MHNKAQAGVIGREERRQTACRGVRHYALCVVSGGNSASDGVGCSTPPLGVPRLSLLSESIRLSDRPRLKPESGVRRRRRRRRRWARRWTA